MFPYVLAYFVMHYVLAKEFQHFRVALVDASDFNRFQEVPRTFGRVIRIWFAYSWRVWVYNLVLYVVAGFVVGFFTNVVTRSPIVADAVNVGFRFVVTGAVGLYVFYDRILDDVFADARVCLLRREDASAPTQANAAVGPAVS